MEFKGRVPAGTKRTFDVTATRRLAAPQRMTYRPGLGSAPVDVGPDGIAISSLKVGDVEQLEPNSVIPMDVFSPEALYPIRMLLDTAEPGSKVSIELRNDGTQTRDVVVCLTEWDQGVVRSAVAEA